MGYIVRTSLPGYNAGTDTNLDHYSLYSDVDNIMIKNQQKGLGTVSAAGTIGYTKTTINHGLGYIPFYMVYDNAAQSLGTKYQILNNQYNAITVPHSISGADTQNIYIINFNSGTTDPYAYEIFYNDMTLGTPSFTSSHKVIDVSRPGKDISSTNPNDFIMNSDLNTYKILSIGTTSISIPAGATGTIAHGATINNPVESFVFLKETGKYPTFLLGGAAHQAFDGSQFLYSYVDPSNIYINNYGSGTFVGSAVYYLMGQGANVSNTGYEMVISKPRYNVLDNSIGIVQTTDTNNANGIQGGTASSGENAQACAESFISTTEKISSVDLKFTKYGTPTDNIQLDIVPTLGGSSLGSAILASANINNASKTNFKFPSSVPTTIGGTYNLQVTRSGIRDATNYWAWYLAYNTNPYSNGNIITRNNGIWSSVSSDLVSDMYFNILADSTANSDNCTFHSSYPTLKYANSGTYTMTNISTSTLGTVSHNLGYTPFYIGFVNDFTGIAGTIMNGNTEPVYAIVPFYYGNSTIPSPNRNVGAFIYADQNNIYFKAWFDTNAVGTYSFTFYYKLFKNNLGF